MNLEIRADCSQNENSVIVICCTSPNVDNPLRVLKNSLCIRNVSLGRGRHAKTSSRGVVGFLRICVVLFKGLCHRDTLVSVRYNDNHC